MADNQRDEAFRAYALEQTMWKVLLRVGTPLAFYESLNTLYKLLDSLMASHISAASVSTVAYLAQIKMVISSVGAGLAVGSSIKISESYGKGLYKEVEREVSSLILLCVLLNILVLSMIPAAGLILKIAGTPAELIFGGVRYFQLELAGVAVAFLNNIYIAVERVRGRTKRIFLLNMAVIGIKLSLTAVFVYGLNGDILTISAAGLISQVFLLVVGSVCLLKSDSFFGFQLSAVSLSRRSLQPMVKLSVPIMVEKTAFSLGKLIMNAMCGRYGSLTVGALSICNSLTGVFSNAATGFQDGCAALISQNLGAGKKERTLQALQSVFITNFCLCFLGTVLLLIFKEPISILFATSSAGVDMEFKEIIGKIFIYDVIGTVIPWGIDAAAEAFLYGLGKTRQILFINFCRLFVFRIFVFWLLQNFTAMGSEAVGITMMISNSSTAVLSCVLAAREANKIKKEIENGNKVFQTERDS